MEAGADVVNRNAVDRRVLCLVGRLGWSTVRPSPPAPDRRRQPQSVRVPAAPVAGRRIEICMDTTFDTQVSKQLLHA